MNRVKVMGGLGNQFFQYAFAKELEYKTEEQVQLTTEFFRGETNIRGGRIPTRFFLLEKFNCRYETVPENDTYRCSKKVQQDDYDAGIIYDDTYFVGYWQSESFFYDVRELVRKDLTLKNEYIDDTMRKTAVEMAGVESVSLHVRRTDYVSLGIYPICGRDYYERAVKYIKDYIKSPVLYIFSDDMAWCHENLDNLYGCRTVFISSGVDYKDWYLMQQTKHSIIANSTFSFWAAYAQEGKERIVCAPEKWANEGMTAPDKVGGWKYL